MINCLDVLVYSSIATTFMLIIATLTIYLVLVIQKLARSESNGLTTLPDNDDFDFELILNLDPDETEQQILDLHAQGWPKTRIAMEVFGTNGRSQSKKVEDVISRWGS